MKSAGKARSNGLYRHIRTSKEIIRNLLNDSDNSKITLLDYFVRRSMISLLLFTNLVIWSTESGWLESIARS